MPGRGSIIAKRSDRMRANAAVHNGPINPFPEGSRTWRYFNIARQRYENIESKFRDLESVYGSACQKKENNVEHDKHLIERGIAQGGATSSHLTDFARTGMLDFLRKQITDAEWEIARQKATIDAYEHAIRAIEAKITSPAQ